MEDSSSRPLQPMLGADRLVQRAGAVFGVAAVALGFSAIGAAVSMSPWFDWNHHALSDLGHPSRSSSTVFNWTLIIAGALYEVFVWGLSRDLPRSWPAKAGLAVLGFGGLSLALVGLFNESWGAVHTLVSVTYFASTPIGILILSRPLRAMPRSYFVGGIAAATAAGAFGLSIWAALEYGYPFTSQAIPETLASIFLGGWTVATARLLYRGEIVGAPG